MWQRCSINLSFIKWLLPTQRGTQNVAVASARQAVATCIQMSRRVCPQRTLATGVVVVVVVVVAATVAAVVAPLVLASVNLVDCFSRATFVTMLHAALQRALSKGDRPRRVTE